ncbi:hypothetical protein [Halococcus qingdaonensis]|uniref:hypothetical protein n=1 Tax=Halococcus qingdaonensis TaxID=224402 RepID=UPI002115FB1B|nr:hypothetical protein [Halococcus qingdaonensis]
MTESFSSRWWYGIAATLVLLLLGWIGWAGVRLTTTIVPETDPSQLAPHGIESLVVLLGTFVFVVATWTSAPIFTISLFMDARAVGRGDFEWRPNQYLYGLVGLLHLGALFTVVVYAVTMPVALFYLYRRHRHVGTP